MDVVRSQRRFDLLSDVHALQGAPVVPLRIEGAWIDFAERQVVTEAQERIGAKHVELRTEQLACAGR